MAERLFNILPYVAICYNKSTNNTHGFTLYELIFGHKSSRPPDTLYSQEELVTKYLRDLNNRLSYYYNVARQRTVAQKQKAKVRFDAHVSKQTLKYQIGQKVYVKESQITDKLCNKFNGSFEILYKNSATLLNENTNQNTKANFDRLKPYFEA